MKTIKINEPFLGFVVGILLFLFTAALFMGCGSNDEAKTENYDSIMKSEHDSMLNELATDTDTFTAPVNNVATQMEIRKNFDTIK